MNTGCVYLTVLATLLTFQVYLASASLNLTSNGNAYIQTETKMNKFEELVYEKQERDPKSNITLIYFLTGDPKLNGETVRLKINGDEQKVFVFPSDNIPNTGYSWYIVRQDFSNKIAYKVVYRKISDVIPGEYQLTIETKSTKVSAIAKIFSPPVAQTFQKLKLGLVGDPMRVTCKYNSYEGLVTLKWYKLASNIDSTKPGNLTLENAQEINGSNPHVVISEGKSTNKTNDTLYIEKLESTDIGLYVCKLSHGNNSDQAVVRINVKDRWAALYPFFGIILEVVLVVALILVYERYQLRNQNQKQRQAYNEDGDEEQVGNEGDTNEDNNTENMKANVPLNNVENEEQGDETKNNGVNDSLRQRNPEC